MTEPIVAPFIDPAKALHEIDLIIGNQDTITREELGEIRGIVLSTLNVWHENFPGAACHERIEIDPESQVRI
jgi:hypothetical protein